MPFETYFMEKAIDEAFEGMGKGEVPIGALIVNAEGQIVASGHNSRETKHGPCDHAEINVLTKAGHKNKNFRLSGHTLYVSLEPCPMCFYAMILARIDRVVFGAFDPKGGAISLGYQFHRDKRLNHQFSVVGGLKQFECSRMLSDFFRQRRKEHRFDRS